VARLKNKIALVIGAGSSGPGWGNGKATAALFAREGACVIAVDLNRDAVEDTRAVILAEGGRCEALVADATSSRDVEHAIGATLEQFGRIDVLHNNVGGPVMGDPIGASVEDWQRALDLNLTTAFLVCKHALPAMQRQGGGAIVNVSSLASIQINSYPYFGYLTAKAGLNHFTRALAVHFARDGIRANAVLPGVMDTPLIYREIADQHADTEEMLRKRHAASPMGHMGDAWDVAYASLFLASDEAKYITGVCLPIDGGKSCWGR
jgi:NAD(P)-dependent dehydrogenase (short-subunit alcohol dehydrogenase family)